MDNKNQKPGIGPDGSNAGDKDLEEKVNEKGRLPEALAKLDPSTIQHSSEICTDRITNPDLMKEYFYTADGAVYTVEDNNVILYLTDRENNPILNNIEETMDQLRNTHVYVPTKKDLEAAINSPNTLRINLSDLKLQSKEMKEFDKRVSYFKFKIKNYKRQTNARKAFVNRSLGQEKIIGYFGALIQNEITNEIIIYVLNPDYVKEIIKDKGVEAIAQLCVLYAANAASIFNATGNEDCETVNLRGKYLKIEFENEKYSKDIRTAMCNALESIPDITKIKESWKKLEDEGRRYEAMSLGVFYIDHIVQEGITSALYDSFDGKVLSVGEPAGGIDSSNYEYGDKWFAFETLVQEGVLRRASGEGDNKTYDFTQKGVDLVLNTAKTNGFLDADFKPTEAGKQYLRDMDMRVPGEKSV